MSEHVFTPLKIKKSEQEQFSVPILRPFRKAEVTLIPVYTGDFIRPSPHLNSINIIFHLPLSLLPRPCCCFLPFLQPKLFVSLSLSVLRWFFSLIARPFCNDDWFGIEVADIRIHLVPTARTCKYGR